MSRKNNKQAKTTKIARPVCGIDSINQAVRALYGYKKPALYKDLATAANLHPVYLSQALSSARDVGLTEHAGKRGVHKLTSAGEEFGLLVSVGKEAEAREVLKRVILANPTWSEIITFLRLNKGEPRDPLDIVTDVERKLSKRWSSTMRGKLAKAYTSILEYAGIARTDKDRIIPLIGVEEGETERTEETMLTEESMGTKPEGRETESIVQGNLMEFRYGNIFLRIPADVAGEIIPIILKYVEKQKSSASLD